MPQMRAGLIFAFEVVAVAVLVGVALTSAPERRFRSLLAGGLAAYFAGATTHLFFSLIDGIPSDVTIRGRAFAGFVAYLGAVLLFVLASRVTDERKLRILVFGLSALLVAPLFREVYQVWSINQFDLPRWIEVTTSVGGVAAMAFAAFASTDRNVDLLALGLAATAVPLAWIMVSEGLGPAGVSVAAFLGASACFAFALAHADDRNARLLFAGLLIALIPTVWNTVGLAIECGLGTPGPTCTALT